MLFACNLNLNVYVLKNTDKSFRREDRGEGASRKTAKILHPAEIRGEGDTSACLQSVKPPERLNLTQCADPNVALHFMTSDF